MNLSQLKKLLRKRGRFVAIDRVPDSDNISDFLLCEVTPSGRVRVIDTVPLDDTVEGFLLLAGRCDNFRVGGNEGISYGPFCSTYSATRNAAWNDQCARKAPWYDRHTKRCVERDGLPVNLACLGAGIKSPTWQPVGKPVAS